MRISRAAKDVNDIKTWAETIRNNGSKIVEKAERISTTLRAECDDLTAFLDGVRDPALSGLE